MLETLVDTLAVRAFDRRLDDIRDVRCLRVEHRNPGRDHVRHPGKVIADMARLHERSDPSTGTARKAERLSAAAARVAWWVEAL